MKDKVFHQIVRYSYAKQAVNAMRTKKRHRILEVGAGAHGNLGHYLPEDDLTFLDIDLPEEVLEDSRFVRGDATCLIYEEGAFDFVIALDVLEHIPACKRMRFMENIYRTARIGVILSVPHFSERSPFEDELLKYFYLLCGAKPPIWIDEHIECTLPSGNEMTKLLHAQGIEDDHILFFRGVKRELMSKMLIMEAAASKYQECAGFFDIINSDYIRSILYQDIGLPENEAMKTYLIFTKDDSVRRAKAYFSIDHCEAGKRIEAFEQKYSEFMQWMIGFSNRAYMETALKEQGEALRFLSENNMEEMRSHFIRNADALQAVSAEHADARRVLSDEKAHRICDKLSKEADRIFTGIKENADIVLKTVEKGERNILGELGKLTGNGVRLNVLLITYNHAEFIKQALESILMQRTTFAFNIIVADDGSSDGTVSIIRSMAEKTEIPFIFLPGDNNLGITKNYKRAFEACDAQYAAVMEGDDLWTDSLRLQKHVDFLEEHCECAMSFNRYVVKDFEAGTIAAQPILSGEEANRYYKYFSRHDLAYDNVIGNFSTCVYRSGVLKALPEQMFELKCYDWLTNMMVSKMGQIGCLVQPMSIYRVHSGGTWSGQSNKEKIRNAMEAIDVYDEFTNREFSAGFAAHKARLQLMLSIPEPPPQSPSGFKEIIKCLIRKCYALNCYLPPVFGCFVNLFIPPVIKDILEDVRRRA